MAFDYFSSWRSIGPTQLLSGIAHELVEELHFALRRLGVLRLPHEGGHAAAIDQTLAEQPEGLPPVWMDAAPGIWKADVGTPESVSLLDMAGIVPRTEALSRKASDRSSP